MSQERVTTGLELAAVLFVAAGLGLVAAALIQGLLGAAVGCLVVGLVIFCASEATRMVHARGSDPE